MAFILVVAIAQFVVSSGCPYLPVLPAVLKQIYLSLSVRLVLQRVDGDLVAFSAAFIGQCQA